MLNIYRGRETVDKEKFIYSRIKEIGGRTIVIVPDQYTLVAEKQALKKLESKVLLDIEILSLSRLGSRLLSESGKDRKTLLNKYGRHMLVSKILRNENDNLDAFKGMHGRENFVAAVNNFISKAKQYEVKPNSITDLLSKAESETALQRKLKDLNLVYEKYEEAIADKYTDVEDLIAMYREAALESELIAASHIWIYGFDSFTPRNLSFIAALISRAKSCNVFLTWDENSRDEDLFRLSGIVTAELVKAAEEAGSKYSVTDLGEEEYKTFAANKRAAGIATLEKELFSVGITPKKGAAACEGISIVKCGTPYAEAEAAASHVRTLLQEKNYHLNDMLIVCNDQSERGGLIKRIFQEYGLEIFDDKKRRVASSAIAVFISSFLCAVIYRYRAEDIMRAIKTGLIDISRDEIALLEQYAYRFRVRGNMWKKPFERGEYMRRYRDGGLEKVERVRQKVVAPFIAFEEINKNSKTYGEFIRAFKKFLMEDLQIVKRMDDLSAAQREIGAFDVAEETAQLWEIILATFSQIEEIMDDTEFDVKEFSDLLSAGLSQIEVGVLPPSADDMLLGTMQRTRAGDVKAVIVMGANDGILPLSPSDDILFSKEEMAELEGKGITFGSDLDVKRMEEDLALYRCLFKPEEDLWISYSTSDTSGGALQPSEIIAVIKKIFKDIKEETDPNLSEEILPRLGGETNTFRRYSEAMRELKLGLDIDPGWEVVSEWLESCDEKSGRNMLASFRENLEFENVQEPIGKEIAAALHGEAYSPSELETYSRCPYQHFVSYGLNAEEEKVDEVAGREIGNFYHGTLERFAAELTDKNLWDSITKEDAEKMIDAFSDEWATNYNDGLFKVSGAEKYLLRRAVNSCKFFAWTLVEQARSGEIKDSRYEVKFGRWGESGDGRGRLEPITRTLSDGRKVFIEGRIDRLDTLKSDRVKVIDYKTGNMKFDVNGVKAGYMLQLMLYLEAAREEKRKPAGVFYFLIQEPRVDVDRIVDDSGASELEENIRSKSQMDGIVVDKDEVIREIAGDFEGTSSVIKLTKTKTTGGFDKRCEKYLISDEVLDGLQSEVKTMTTKLCEEILSGRIELGPKQGKKVDPCKYCQYHSICNFDRSFSGCSYEYV